ncbi:hypothetical protein BH10ACI2_BH10ACI2_19250 [soil metagenome]
MEERSFISKALSLRKLCVLFFWCLSVAIFVGTSAAQRAKDPEPKPSPAKTPDPNITRWKIFLDGLVQEVRTISPEERRPFAVTDVAAAYWEIDRDESQAMFVAALDVAWKLTEKMKPSERRQQPVLDYVLSTAARIDSALLKSLIDRLRKKDGAEKEADDIASGTALELLETDPEKAAQLAEAFAPNGLDDGTALFFIFRLAQKDISLANRVYETYLTKAGASENMPVEYVVRLAGYAFGHLEYYGVDKRGELSGANFRRIPGFSANQANINSFLSLAYRRIGKAIEQRNNAAGAGNEGLGYPILFSLAYLEPDAARFLPASGQAWQQLQQQGIVGTTPEQSQKIATHMNTIYQGRDRLQTYEEAPEKLETNTEASLADVEKLVGTCQRDVVRSKAVVQIFNYRKNFKRALQVAGEIEDTKQNEAVMQILIVDMAEAAIKDGDWDEAEKQIKKISSTGIRAIATAVYADALIKKGEKATGEKKVDEAAIMAEKLSEAKERSGLLFALSAILLKSDPVEARSLLAKAVKDLNKQEPADKFKFSIPLRVSLSCDAEPSTYWADQDLPKSNILEAVPLFAKDNPDETSSAIDAISDKITKIRSQSIVAKIALQNLKKQAVKPSASEK